jgi:hypothetical protein
LQKKIESSPKHEVDEFSCEEAAADLVLDEALHRPLAIRQRVEQ